jgi:glutamine amidotransferase
MCLAIYKPRGIQIAKKYLQNGFTNNDDGAGFAIATRDKRLQVYKGFATFDAFYTEYLLHAAETMIIHFRWATHGDRTEYNCHPFEMCNGQIAMVHNGILDIDIPDGDKQKSDTRVYCEAVLEPLLYRVPVDHPSLTFLLEKAIGSSNKIILLACDGKYSIVNAVAGEWHKGAWYSNTGYKYSTSWNGYGYSGFGSRGCSETGSYHKSYSGGRAENYGTQEYWDSIYGKSYPAGCSFNSGKEIRLALPEVIDLPADSPAIPPVQEMTDEELGISTVEETCDCGSQQIMAVGDHISCAYCGVQRSQVHIIDPDESPLADDTEAIEADDLQQWEAAQRQSAALDNGR